MTQRYTLFLMRLIDAIDKTVLFIYLFFFFSHYQICMCVVKLEICPMRAVTTTRVTSRAATRQCEQIIKTNKVLFLSVSRIVVTFRKRLLKSSHTESERTSDTAMRLTEKMRTLYISMMYSRCTRTAAV